MDKYCKCNIKKIKTNKQALKEKVGTFYHPTKSTYRTGKCPIHFVSKKAYNKKSYIKKNGTIVKGVHVNEKCIKNKGKPGKTNISSIILPKLKNKGLLEKYGYSTHKSSNNRFISLINAAKEISYRSVMARINYIRTLSKSDKKLYKIYSDDVENLKKWRIKNPDLYKKSIK